MRRRHVYPLSLGDVFSESREDGVRNRLTVLKFVPPFVRLTLHTTSAESSQRLYLEGRVHADWRKMLVSPGETEKLDVSMRKLMPQGPEAEGCSFLRLRNAAGGDYLLCYHGARRSVDGLYCRENLKKESELHLRMEPQGLHGYCYGVFETL